jgi:threonine/homoserine/homoserine lactone efflux protein
MDMSNKILLGLLLAALAAFPVAVFLYLRTAYREGRWAGVKTALAAAGMALLVWVALDLWAKHVGDLVGQVMAHPFALTTVLLIVLSWLLHQALKAQLDETHDDY